MSNILVQNIKHTNNTTSMTVDTSGQVSVRSEGSATTTNLQQGLAKAFANSNPEGTNLNDSFNISSLGDQGTGIQRFNLSNAMNNTTFATVTCVQVNIDQEWEDTGNRTTSMAELRAYDETSGYTDVAEMMAILGDLA
tara:strand:+ start:146 stop:559 length:414 start_codon:yes stop_codon:yes gene_type:complete